MSEPEQPPPPAGGFLADAVANLRDLGGKPTPAGTVRTGLVFRSAQLGAADPSVASLGIRSVFDLRTAAEREMQADVVPDGAAYAALDVLADAPGAGPAQLLEVLADPSAATAALGDGRAERMFADGYRAIVGLPSALASYRALFTALAEDTRRPALFHCTTGKDRTGWAAASLLLLLGVADEDVMADYLLTNDALLPALAPVMDGFAARGGDPALLLPVLGVRSAYLEAALAEMRTRFGSIDGYFSDGLGLGPDVVGALRTGLVAPE